MERRFEPGPLDQAPSRRRTALRRLPLTIAVLAIVGGSAAGLAYVASGSGTHRFRATIRNDLGRVVQVGGCEKDDCTGGMLSSYRLAPGRLLSVGLRPGGVVNPILVTTLESKRLGCFFLRYAEEPSRPPLIRLSSAQPC
jgi:hypothetical protein